MVKNPTLSIVSPGATNSEPPRQLGSHGRKLWNEVQNQYGIDDVGGRELLAQACASLDRAEQLAAAIATDGATVYTRNGIPRSHPACRDELAARAFVVRTLEKLGITVENVKPHAGHPPRPTGWTGD